LGAGKVKDDMKRLVEAVRGFWVDEQGQDLIEYTLLMAFVALASAALFLGAGGSVKGIWGTANTQLTTANSIAK
jgi:Flp pilus assembly pilin Flp